MHEKRQALRFLHICLASVLNLRSPDDSELPGGSMDKLTSMLFGNQVHNAPLLYNNSFMHVQRTGYCAHLALLAKLFHGLFMKFHLLPKAA